MERKFSHLISGEQRPGQIFKVWGRREATGELHSCLRGWTLNLTSPVGLGDPKRAVKTGSEKKGRSVIRRVKCVKWVWGKRP